MNKTLVFHYHDGVGNEARMAPSAYYMDADYEPVAVRIYAEDAPLWDAEIDIFDDGVTIFKDRAAITYKNSSRTDYTSGTPVTESILGEDQNSEEFAEDFKDTPIAQGSWVYCNLVDAGGGKNFTVQLELKEISEEGEYDGE